MVGQETHNLTSGNDTIGSNPSTPQTPRLPSAGGMLRYASKANLVLVGLFAAGLMCLYLLSLRGGPAKASAEQSTAELQVDAALVHFVKTPVNSKRRDLAKSLVRQFYLDVKQRQIPLSDLLDNPFVFVPLPGTAKQGPAAPAAAPKPVVDIAEAQAMESVNKLQLQSILMGSHGATAMISNNLLTEGQTIVGWKVSEIRSREVILTRGNKTYVLKMRK